LEKCKPEAFVSNRSSRIRRQSLQANEYRFDPVSRDEADSSVNDRPITGLGIKVPGTSNRAGLESAKSG
jgi:hypothetical protein